MKNWYTVKAAAKPETEPDEVTIYDEIGAYGVSAAMFNRDFKALKSKEVKLLINSPGGNVIQAIAIFNTIATSAKKVTAHVMGIAASAAAYIVLACDSVVMPENTFQFHHDPIAGLMGDAEDHRELADTLDKYAATLMGTYCKRTGKTEEEVKALLAADMLLTAAECKAMGLCSELVPEVVVSALFDTDRADWSAQVKAIFEPKSAPQLAAELGQTLTAHIEAAAKAAGLEAYAGVWATDDKLVTVEAVDKVIAEAREIQAIAKLAGRADDASMLIRSRKSLSEARLAINAAMVAADPVITTAAKSKDLQTKDNQYNPSAIWASINEMNARSAK